MKLDRSTPPRSGSFAKTSFPKYEVFSVHGIPVYLIENHNQPYVGVVMYFRTGATNDDLATQGLSSVVAEMMTKGTTNRTAPEIAEAIDFVGGSLGASTGWDATTVSLSLLKKHLGLGLDLFTDVIRNATFSEEELARVKMQRLASIQHAKSDAGYLADTLFTKVHFAGHPYSLEGTEASIAGMNSDMLRSRHKNAITSGNSFIVVSGDITPEEFTALISPRLSGWEGGTTSSSISSAVSGTSSGRIALIKKEDAVQSAIRLGHTGIHRGHPDYIPITVMNVVLGGFFNSRINQNLRERNGFTYGARSYFDARKQTGAFVVSTEVRTEVTRRAVEEILFEMKKLREGGVTDDELTMVKNYIVGSFPLSLETPQQMLGRLATLPLFELSGDYYDHYIESVRSLTKESINNAAAEYLKPESVLIAISGNTDVLKNDLTGLGDITLYDTNFEIQP
jgi:zinc protease